MIKAGGAITIHLEGDRKNRPSKKCENQSIMSRSPPPLPSVSLSARRLIFLPSLSATASFPHSLLLSLLLFLNSSLLCFLPRRSLIYIFLFLFPSLSFLPALYAFSISLVTISTLFGLIKTLFPLLVEPVLRFLWLSIWDLNPPKRPVILHLCKGTVSFFLKKKLSHLYW